MRRRHTSIPRQWLIADERLGSRLWSAVRKLPRGSGVLVLYRQMPAAKRSRLVARLRRIGRDQGLVIADEAAGEASRVHDQREIRIAGVRGIPLLFLSPLYPTRSHPDWAPLTAMRAAALVRLAKVPVIALGGMDAQRWRGIERLGFHGWAGIDAWVEP